MSNIFTVLHIVQQMLMPPFAGESVMCQVFVTIWGTPREIPKWHSANACYKSQHYAV